MTSEIHIGKSEFLHAMDFIKFPYANNYNVLTSLKFTIELNKDNLVLNTLGAYSSPIVCSRNDTDLWNIELPFRYIYSIVKNAKGKEVKISFEKNTFTLENVTIAGVRIIKRENNKNVGNTSKIELPLNYTDNDLLCLKSKYSENEINQNNVGDFIEDAERRFEINLNAAIKYLKIYGLTYTELRDYIFNKINK